MTVLAAAVFGVLALSPVWLAWWVRRHPRPLRKPGAAWVGLSVTIATCWLGVMGFYLFFVRTDTASGGHPLAAIITLVVLALAVVLGITGSTILWRAERSARTRNAALGLATGRRWWPNWLALLGCVILAPALVVIAGVALTAIVDSASATPLTTDQVNSYMFPTIAFTLEYVRGGCLGRLSAVRGVARQSPVVAGGLAWKVTPDRDGSFRPLIEMCSRTCRCVKVCRRNHPDEPTAHGRVVWTKRFG